ncbi:MAG: alcohol dehydrogenase catalytic domain-containing protein [Nitrospirota bacterium]|nr:alcohol dehydrogenase catalytic domain-containing protein [Nitrospirota bacterium]
MRGLIFDHRGLSCRTDLPRPEAAPGEALVRVKLAGICATDLAITNGYMGFCGVLGHEFTATVESVTPAPVSPEGAPSATSASTATPDVGHWIGKRVVGEINAACGKPACPACRAGRPRHCPSRSVLGILGRSGAFAEYLTLPLSNLHPLPAGVTDQAAVFVEPLAAAFRILEQVRIATRDTVYVMGDGRLGLLIAQVLATTGCHLTLLGKHPEKRAVATKWGIASAPPDADLPPADVVVDATGSADGLGQAVARTRPCGTVVLKSTCATAASWNPAPLVIDEITVVGSRCGPFEPALAALAAGHIDVAPLIAARYALDDGVAAIRHAATPGVLKVLLEP